MAVNPVSGAGYLLAGLRLIAHPGLRRFVAIPLGINILVFSAAIYWGVGRFEDLIAWLQSRLPRLPDWLSWLRWLEQGLEWVLWPLFIMLAALLVFYGFTLVANLISAPFNGLLAEKVEHLERGAPLDKGLGMGQGIPSDKRLKKGDILNIDITVIKDGYHGDTSKMFFIGDPSILARRLVKVTQEALRLGLAEVRPGATLGDIGHVIQSHVESHRFSVVEEYCGHGIGRDFHEEPQVLHYGRRGEGMVLRQGMCFTIEPMVNAGKRYIKLLPDGWTVVTKDRALSAQWEHTVLVTPEGHEVLTLRQEERAELALP